MIIRPIAPGDLPAVDAIQALSPEAPAWPVNSYLRTFCLVAVERRNKNDIEEVLGFAAARQTVSTEAEILNIAVHPSARRRGVARALLLRLLEVLVGDVFLEVRASNLAAIQLYESINFVRVGIRPAYYSQPGEDGIVLKFQAC